MAAVLGTCGCSGANVNACVVVASGDSGVEIVVYFPTVDCILKLGQFLGQLQSGLRTSA